MNKPKAQGTRFESYLVNRFNEAGIPARRLAEGGSYDLGDIEAGSRFIIEAKHRTNLAGGPTGTFRKAAEKAAARAGSIPLVIWKRSIKRKGNTKRTQDGPILVILALDDLLQIIGGARTARRPIDGNHPEGEI